MNIRPTPLSSAAQLGAYIAGRAVEISALAWEARRHAQALAAAIEHGASAPDDVAQREVAHAERRLTDVAGILRTARARFETLPLGGGEAGE